MLDKADISFNVEIKTHLITNYQLMSLEKYEKIFHENFSLNRSKDFKFDSIMFLDIYVYVGNFAFKIFRKRNILAFLQFLFTSNIFRTFCASLSNRHSDIQH